MFDRNHLWCHFHWTSVSWKITVSISLFVPVLLISSWFSLGRLNLSNYFSISHRLCILFTYAAKSLQSCPTLCDPMDCSLPGFSVHVILQARTLEWVAISFSNAWKWKVKVKSLSRVWLLTTSWTAAYQAPPSMGFSGQQYWSGVPLLSPLFTYSSLY